eukprot:TRINITY_DN195_c1_g1_i3.p1 TRINITY_DN195_c1_g1~~TRINITY_DN195_c1_g1_i3.p1  ORF type:complete len:119 (+),score=11.25 TRINITY_DN195_c1_g1_i3:58-414(+)
MRENGGGFFFFKQKTAYEIKECDWSSDVCSSRSDKVELHVLPPHFPFQLSGTLLEGTCLVVKVISLVLHGVQLLTTVDDLINVILHNDFDIIDIILKVGDLVRRLGLRHFEQLSKNYE